MQRARGPLAMVVASASETGAAVVEARRGVVDVPSGRPRQTYRRDGGGADGSRLCGHVRGEGGGAGMGVGG
jgi:hypothetical protein